jgi:hypothetical protein
VEEDREGKGVPAGRGDCVERGVLHVPLRPVQVCGWEGLAQAVHFVEHLDFAVIAISLAACIGGGGFTEPLGSRIADH